MAKFPESERRYSDKELALILKLAAERSASSSESGGYGLTLAEIQQIAADAGIDPQHVIEAATALDTQHGSRALSWLGAPTRFVFDRTVAGDVTPTEISEIIDLIRQVTGMQGEVSQVFDSVEWKGHDLLDRHAYVTIRRQQGQTKIKVVGHWWGLALIVYLVGGAAGLLATIGIGKLIDPASAVGVGALVAGGVSGAYLTARTMWRHIARNVESKLKELTRRIGDMVPTAAAAEVSATVEVEPERLSQQPEETAPQRPRISPSQRA
jgi:hypothetical protein